MNLLPKFLTSAQPAPSKASDRYRQYRTTGNGKIEVYLPPQRGDELRAKLAAADKDRAVKVDAAAELRATKLKEARAVYETAREAIEREHRQSQHKANTEFDEIEARLLAEFAAPLSQEQIAIMTTPVGGVVRMPATPQVANA